jgi:integrase
MSTAIRGFYRRYATSGDYTWHIDKRIKRVGRLCESTGTADRDEAERYLLHRIRELRDIAIYGVRPPRKFHEAAAKYLNDFALKSTVRRDAVALKDLEPYIGHLWLDQINNDSFNAYRNARQDLTIITRNGKIGVARRILKLAAEVWCYPNTNITWLERAPTILAEKGHRPRDPYPLDASEQELLFSELTADRRRIALFAVNTGLRDQELCRLQWTWEVRIPELTGRLRKRKARTGRCAQRLCSGDFGGIPRSTSTVRVHLQAWTFAPPPETRDRRELAQCSGTRSAKVS